MKPCPHCGALCDPIKAHHPNTAAPGGSSHPNTFLAAGSVMLALALTCAGKLYFQGLVTTDASAVLLIGSVFFTVGTLIAAVGFMVAYGDWYVAMCPKCYKGFSISPKDLKGR